MLTLITVPSSETREKTLFLPFCPFLLLPFPSFQAFSPSLSLYLIFYFAITLSFLLSVLTAEVLQETFQRGSLIKANPVSCALRVDPIWGRCKRHS